MPNQKRKSLKNPRKRAFLRQNGRCCYCHKPMWLDNSIQYAKQHGLTIRQARQMQCTGEHLEAHKDGGSDSQENIAAACWFCNSHRHKRKNEIDPERYEQYVLRRQKKGR